MVMIIGMKVLSDTYLRGGQTLLGELADVFLDLV